MKARRKTNPTLKHAAQVNKASLATPDLSILPAESLQVDSVSITLPFD
jgi:hypothetical protein